MQQFREVILLHCCFTSTEARWLIRDGDRVGRGQKSEGSTADTARKRPERTWTAARTMEVLAVSPRHCPATCALRNCCFKCCAWTESQRQCPLHGTAVDEQLGQLEAKEVQLSQPSSSSLLMISSGLSWRSSSTSLLSLRSLDLLISAWNLAVR